MSDAPRVPENGRPAPLTPADCDLRDFPRMMIDIVRLRASAFDATPDDAVWRAALNLWFSSWHSVPAASLETDEASLCKAAGLGRDLRTWKKIAGAAMRGWTLCEDGRLYHATVAEFALEAWIEKLAQRLSSGAGNASRWKTTFDPAPIQAAQDGAVAQLIALNPASKAIPRALRRRSQLPPDPIPDASRRDAGSIPSGSQETGKEEVETDVSPSGARDAAQGEESQFRELAELYASLVVRGRGSRMQARSVWLRLAPSDRAALPAAVRRFAEARPWGSNGPPALQRFIGDDVWRDFAGGGTVTSIVWTGPPELRAAVVAETSEAFARSYLDPATWLADARTPTIAALTGGAAARLRTVTALAPVAIQDPILPRRTA